MVFYSGSCFCLGFFFAWLIFLFCFISTSLAFLWLSFYFLAAPVFKATFRPLET
ncbi:hypothetical protein P167DRAFT_537075 [Morchella conica CCBAS932]|uniref:Uncharacterized protein n=1 Tax=Morchella conica CCBAS932 TaxID=1392247 RepID=A0A3N4KZ93_9PEZI|nr:hypothetical protein P167DRAFT_537075 [Morchella conica CCBAS932]